MNKIYYIVCDTCRKSKSLPKGNNLVFRDIKQTALTEEELEEMYLLSNMKFCLVKAQLYKSMDLKNKSLTEADYKKVYSGTLYVFKPAGFIIDNVYIGGNQQNMLQVMKALGNV
jgi:arsenate reductase